MLAKRWGAAHRLSGSSDVRALHVRRAAESKVELTLASLMPCAFNLFHWPLSWFNRFAQRERPPTIINPLGARNGHLRTRPSPPPGVTALGQTTRGCDHTKRARGLCLTTFFGGRPALLLSSFATAARAWRALPRDSVFHRSSQRVTGVRFFLSWRRRLVDDNQLDPHSVG